MLTLINNIVKVKEAVDKVKSEEEEIKAQYPLLAEKMVFVYMVSSMTQRKASQAYYENIHAYRP